MPSLKEEIKQQAAEVAAPPSVHRKLNSKRATLTVNSDGSRTYAHDHGDGESIIESVNPKDGSRDFRPGKPRFAPYLSYCKACQQDDLKRQAEIRTLTDDEIDNTIFLVPPDGDDYMLAVDYLKTRYGDELIVSSDILPMRLAVHTSARVVVVTRRVAGGNKTYGSRYETIEDKKGNPVQVFVPFEKHYNEVFESKPINVSECVTGNAASYTEDGHVDVSELHRRLCEAAAPRYYVVSYQYVIGSPDPKFSMRLL